MPSKRCLVKNCKTPAKRIFRIPNEDTVGPEIRNKWLAVVDTDNRKNLGDPYGVCLNHFSGDCFDPQSLGKDNKGRPKLVKLKGHAFPTNNGDGTMPASGSPMDDA